MKKKVFSMMIGCLALGGFVVNNLITSTVHAQPPVDPKVTAYTLRHISPNGCIFYRHFTTQSGAQLFLFMSAPGTWTYIGQTIQNASLVGPYPGVEVVQCGGPTP